MSKKFERKFPEELKKNLIAAPLYKKLKDDIYRVKIKKENGKCDPIYKVFPAIRNGYIDFYYKGGRLFEFTDKGFATHLKYGLVCNDNEKDIDITEDLLAKPENFPRITKFENGYERIKERCALYHRGLESSFVAKLFDNYSYVTNTKDSDITGEKEDDIVVLDIEAALSNQKNEKGEKFEEELDDILPDAEADLCNKKGKKNKKKLNKVDIVLYHKKKQLIKFVEAKLYSNTELSELEQLEYPNSENTDKNEIKMVPKVINQICRYENKIKEQKEEIKNAYKEYIDIVNDLFKGVNLPNDNITVCEKVGLIFFDFDGAHVGSAKFKRIKKKLKEDISDKRNVYSIGDTESPTLSELFRCTD